MSHRPILIVGANGAGTTLLRLMLDSHDRIAIPAETGFLRLAMSQLWVPYWQLGDQWAGHLDLTDDELLATLADFYGGLFASYAETRGKQRWGDKTPFHVWHLKLAVDLFPDAQVVGIVRHPAAVVSSLRRRFRRSESAATGHWWRSTTRLVNEAQWLGERCVLLRYEDLVLDPEAVMRSLLAWLDEPWSDAVLSHHQRPHRTGAAVEVEGFTRTDSAIDPSHIAGWEQHLRGAALAMVVERTGALAEFLGYTPDAATPLLPFGAAADRPLLTGVEVGQRRADHGGGLDWERLPRVNAEDLPLRPPPPRPKGRRRRQVSLDDVVIRDVLRHRATSWLHTWVPERARQRANRARRSRPLLDRLLGPRQPGDPRG